MENDWIVPDWPAPLTVRAVTTTRHRGVSGGPWQSMNPADHVGDDPAAVAANRTRLAEILEVESRLAQGAGASGKVRLSPEEAERLRGLGYLVQ